MGPGDLIIGAPADHLDLFETSLCHGHYHFKEYADYRLWTPAAYATWTELRNNPANQDTLSSDLMNTKGLSPVESGKRGFCVIDVVRVKVPGVKASPPKYTSCSSNQGISVGWADQYSWTLDGQWIDVTDVAPGNYVLEVEVNAERVFTEVNYLNNSAAASVSIP